MVENNAKGREARIYFIECEKRLKEVAQPKLPKTYLEALKELVKIEEEKKIIAAKNKVELAQYELKEKELKAKANKIEAESLSNNLLKKMLIEKWDRKLPTTMSDSEIIKMINN